MWKPYLKVIAKKAGHAIHVLDCFHIMAAMSKAIDKVRAEEARKLKREGYEPVLTNTRWLLLKRPENLTAKQEPKLRDLLRYNLQAVRSYLLKEEFQLFWSYKSPYLRSGCLNEGRGSWHRQRYDPEACIPGVHWEQYRKRPTDAGVFHLGNAQSKETT